MKRGTGIVSLLVLAALLSSCGGGGGTDAPSPYTGLTTAAVITDNNADVIARAAFEGGDLGANAGIILAPAGAVPAPAAGSRPRAVALVQTLAKAALPAVRPPSAAAPRLRAPFEESNTIYDGQGGYASYSISGDDQTMVFQGTFTFSNFQGDGGGFLNGTVAVSGSIAQDSIHFLFNFQSLQLVDTASDFTASGTVDLTANLTSGTGTATLNLFFVDNVTLEAVWLSNLHVVNVEGSGFTEVTLSGRIYLHNYGYVDVATTTPFHYLDGATFPSGGQMTVRGHANHGVRMTVDSETQYTLEVDSDGDGPFDDLTITLNW
jgi:hypothetical protein